MLAAARFLRNVGAAPAAGPVRIFGAKPFSTITTVAEAQKGPGLEAIQFKTNEQVQFASSLARRQWGVRAALPMDETTQVLRGRIVNARGAHPSREVGEILSPVPC